MRLAPIASVTLCALLLVAADPAGGSVVFPLPPAGAKAYVSRFDGDAVDVYDLTTMSLLTTVPVGDGPRRPSVSPNGDLVFVPNFNGSDFPAPDVVATKGGPKGEASTVRLASVSVISTATDQVVATVPLTNNDGPFACVASPDGATLYVSCRGSDDVAEVDLGSFEQTDTLDLTVSGGNPEGIAITPDGAKLYVAIRGDNTVGVLDTATRQEVRSPIPVGTSQPTEVAVNGAGTRVFVVGATEPTVLETSTDTVRPTSFDDLGTQTDVVMVGDVAYVANNLFDFVFPAKGGPKASASNGDASVDVYDLAEDTHVESIRVNGTFVTSIDKLRDGSLLYVTPEASGALREVYPADSTDTGRATSDPSNDSPLSVVIVQPRPVVNSFFLPKKVAVKKNAKTPAKSKFSAGGFFDTGSRVVDLTASATLTVGGVDIPVPGFTASSNGRTFTYQSGGLKFVIAKNPFGSSRAKFRLTNTGDLGPTVPTDGPLTLRFKNAAVDGECEVSLENGGFRIGKKRGSLTRPNLFVVRANGVIGGAGKDAFGVIVGLATNGQTPASAQEIRVEFATKLKAVIPAGSFVRKGDQDVFKGNVNGVTDVVVDYLREQVTIFGKNADVGTFREGQNPITIFVGVGAEDRGVAVRMAREGKLLRY